MARTLTDALRDEYRLLFARMELRPERRAEIERINKRITAPEAKRHYEEVARQTGVPWFVVGIIHNLEASGRFDRHLHNGDPLTGPTTHVPEGRPAKEKRAYSWVESAVDALRLKKLDERQQWSVADIAFVLESYNGFGYRNKLPHVKSPYLWSFSNIYSSGKFVRDHVFSETAVSQQCGGLCLLRAMIEASDGLAALVGFDVPGGDEGEDHDLTRPFPFISEQEGEEVPDDQPAGEPPRFPGRFLVNGLEDDEDVKILQRRLNELGFAAGIVDGDFGDVTEQAVRLFQARSADPSGEPLALDGIVGPSTWAALFGPGSVEDGAVRGPIILQAPASVLGEAALAAAASQVGVRERPLRSNRGPRVDQYIRQTGLDPAGRHAWCMCFVYWCFEQAAEQLKVANPCPRKAGVHLAWKACREAAANGARSVEIVAADEARRNPAKVRPGMVFFIDTGRSTGHVGIVAANENGALETIEGNTNDDGSREGVGVFRRRRRKIRDINLGYARFA